jgi:hypothetical protein
MPSFVYRGKTEMIKAKYKPLYLFCPIGGIYIIAFTQTLATILITRALKTFK